MKFIATASIILLIAATTGDEALIHSLPGKITVASCKDAENLRIYPLTFSGSSKSFMTLKTALAKDLIVVKEKGDGDVNTVVIKNKGNSTVFVMAGEVIKGAKQDRMIENDLLIPPESKWVEVAVYCTEHGRWHGSSKEFAAADISVSPSVRANARKEKSQSEVWAKVAENQQDVMGSNSETGAFAHIYDSKSYKDDRDDYYKKLKGLPDQYPSMKGVLVCVGDDILCVDLFGSHTVLDNLWPKLLESYIVEAMRSSDKGSVSVSEAKKFIDEFRKVDLDDEYTPGAGDLYEIASYDGQGSAMIYKGMLVHSDLFPD
jgi:hypothetical protein